MTTFTTKANNKIINGFTSLYSVSEEIRNNQQIREALINYLLADRMSNYGYDYQSWNRLRNQRANVKSLLRRLSIDALNWGNIGYSRWVIESYTDEKVELSYIVGQSSNEEITNIMKALCDYPRPRRKK